MPPKSKIVKKIVRKTKAKSQPEPEPVIKSSPPPAEEAPEPEPTPEPEPAAAATSTEALDKEPEPAAAQEPLAEEPAAMDVAGSEEPAATETLAAEPAGGEGAAKKPKTVTRVRKVVKKKIVKKLVPKAAAAAKEESFQEEESPKVVVEEVQKVKEEAAVEVNTTEEQQEIENPSTDDALAPMETAPETEAHDAEVAALGAEKVDDAPKEGEKGGDLEMEVAGNEDAGVSEKSSRKKTEIFVGGLDRDAKEEDLRKVFGEVGEIVEVRMIMDGQSGKNKGYAFVKYADASQAKKAVTQFEKVEICGKLCGASALKGNDTIFLGNIDKKWKDVDIVKLLQEAGIEKIEAVTVMPDSNNVDSNRGFAFLELETNKDAQNAYKKLQKKDALGKGRNIKVAWAEPLNDPDEEEMKKVKSVYAECIPASWDEEKVKELFKKFGDIERIVLARNIKSSKRKDFAFVNYETREAAVSCIESFGKEELTDNGAKLNVKVSLAKPVQKGKQNKGGPKSNNKDSVKEKPKAVQCDTKSSSSFSKGKSSGGGYPNSGPTRSSTNHTRSSTSHELLHVLREQATWRPGQVGYAQGPTLHDYRRGVEGKRPFSSLGHEALLSDKRGYPRARLDSFPSTGSSYRAMPHGTSGPSHPYYQQQGLGSAAGAFYGATDYSATHQMRQGAAPPPYGSSYYPRY